MLHQDRQRTLILLESAAEYERQQPQRTRREAITMDPEVFEMAAILCVFCVRFVFK